MTETLLIEFRRKLFITPMNFLRYIKYLNKFLKQFTEKNMSLLQRYENGIEKIKKTEENVQEIRINLEEL